MEMWWNTQSSFFTAPNTADGIRFNLILHRNPDLNRDQTKDNQKPENVTIQFR